MNGSDPKTIPKLPEWATPEGWRQGLRPQPNASQEQYAEPPTDGERAMRQQRDGPMAEHAELIRQIEAMAQPLGRRLYRGVLKAVRAWQPSDISDVAVLRKVLETMRTRDQLVDRLASVMQQTGVEALQKILRSLQVRSLEHVESIETLERIVRALESQGISGRLVCKEEAARLR